MRTTVALDDDLVLIAQEFTGIEEKTALVREALKALIELQSARRLASLGRHDAKIEECSTPPGGAELILGCRSARSPNSWHPRQSGVSYPITQLLRA